MDLISVIVPAYNAESSIKRCISSILHNLPELNNATYPQIEQVMLNELRRNPFQSIHTQKRLSDIIFLCLLMLSSSLARKVYKYHTK